jgi:hypothetical protein
MEAAGLVYEIIVAACSSPQTMEINAAARADTLVKWILIGEAQAALFVIIATMMAKERWPALLGGAMAGLIMWACYAHAKSAGLANGGPATYNPYGNARSAIILSDDGTNWSPWTTYTHGLYIGRC